jgi:hypothetical protein
LEEIENRRKQHLAQLSQTLAGEEIEPTTHEVSVLGFYSFLIISLILQTAGSSNVRSYSGHLGIDPLSRKLFSQHQQHLPLLSPILEHCCGRTQGLHGLARPTILQSSVYSRSCSHFIKRISISQRILSTKYPIIIS